MSDWKKIWDGKTAEEQILLNGDAKAVLLELKRSNGFDVDGELTFDAFYEQYKEIRDNLQKNGKINSVYEVGCGSGANLYLFEQENFETGGIDYSSGLTDIAKKVLKTNDITCAGAADVPTDIVYDAIFSNSVFSYFDDTDYAESVLEKMYEKSKYAIGLIDIHDIEKKEEFTAYRRQIVKDYDERYKNLPKLFYSKDFFENFARKHNMDIRFLGSNMKGYWNNQFVFSCYIYHII